MGFLNFKKVCSICNREGVLGGSEISDRKWICKECFNKCRFDGTKQFKQMNVEDINAAMIAKENFEKELVIFNETKSGEGSLHINYELKKWAIPSTFFGKTSINNIYNFSDIIDFELLEDGDTITKGGLGSAIAGGVLFGGVGAVVGGITGKKKTKAVCNSLKIKITVKNTRNPVEYINFITTETKKDSWTYKTIYNSAQQYLSKLQLICDSQNAIETINNAPQQSISSADEILKFKNLLDSGVITKEEFDAKKKQLLGL